MRDDTARLLHILKWATMILMVAVTFRIILQYLGYFPIDPQADFVVDHASAFRRIDYRIAFYVHIVASPIGLILGLVLMSDGMRQRYRRLHRIMGRIYVALILFAVVPSGCRLAIDAYAGWRAGVSFMLLTVLLAIFTILGFRAAIQRRFSDHQSWMTRSILLMTSAIVLRLISGGFSLVGIEDAESAYVIAAWLSWTLPLAVFEFAARSRHRPHL